MLSILVNMNNSKLQKTEIIIKKNWSFTWIFWQFRWHVLTSAAFEATESRLPIPAMKNTADEVVDYPCCDIRGSVLQVPLINCIGALLGELFAGFIFSADGINHCTARWFLLSNRLILC